MTETSQLALDLIGTAAIAPITDRAFLRIIGPDATRWLNGMVTNSIQSLAPGEGNYNFLLNAQGRIQGDCTIYREPGEEPTFLLETDSSQLETVHKTLDHFIIMDDVELTPAYTDDSALLLIGPDTSTTLRKLALPTLDPLRLVYADTPHGLLLLTAPAPAILPRFELHASIAALNALQAVANLPEVSAETLEQLRILEGRPKYGVDIRNTEAHKDLPQETAQTHALHFTKGCYLGQEIVERIRSRGQVHRTFTLFTLTGELPALPTPLTANEKPAGELTSATRIGDRIYALGNIRREILDTHQAITYPGGTALPVSHR